MLIIVLTVCAAFAVLAIDLISRRSVPAKKESLPPWCRYDYLGDLRSKKLSPKELADLESIVDDGCKSGWPAGVEDLRGLSVEERAHIKSCSDCQYILILRKKTLPE